MPIGCSISSVLASSPPWFVYLKPWSLLTRIKTRLTMADWEKMGLELPLSG
jgi:hypothetical protein